MLKTLRMAAVACLLLGAACAAQAQTDAPRAVTIEDASWLAGRWVGEGLGGELEEVWSPPAGGQMVGHFRLAQNGAPQFYEIMLMDVADGGVRMRVKHFNPDFVGWERKDAWVTFEPVSASADELSFRGLTIRRAGADEIVMALIIHYPEGEREQTLRFRRAPL